MEVTLAILFLIMMKTRQDNDDLGLVVTDTDFDGNVQDPDPNGTELGVVDVVMTTSSRYLPNTIETDIDSSKTGFQIQTEIMMGDIICYFIGDVVVDNTGFGYDDNDTVVEQLMEQKLN